MAKKKDPHHIKDPTIRKIKNRGFKPIKYHMGGRHECVRYGWIVKEEPKVTIIRLVGDEKNRRVKGRDIKYITEL